MEILHFQKFHTDLLEMILINHLIDKNLFKMFLLTVISNWSRGTLCWWIPTKILKFLKHAKKLKIYNNNALQFPLRKQYFPVKFSIITIYTFHFSQKPNDVLLF